MRIYSRAGFFLADDKGKVEYEFVVIIKFKKEVRRNRRFNILDQLY